MDRSPALFVLLLMAAAITWSSFLLAADAWQLEPAHAAGGSCIGRERDALLAFIQGINDTGGYLESWQAGRQDCCRWAGITCNNVTGNVIRFDLGGRDLSGQISPSLLSLEHLEYLDLTRTSLTGPNGGIPKFLGSIKNLRYLDLSRMNFNGRVPPQLGNLSKLEYLDLSNTRSGMMYSTDISWLSRLPLLVHLEMSRINLSSIPADWPLVVNMIPSLRYLLLSECSLSSASQFLAHQNLTNLHDLDLSYNSFSGPIPESICMLRNLLVLDLSNNFLEGELPWCSKNHNLVFLLLSHNYFSGKFPPTIRNYSSLAFMDLSMNNFNGTLPVWIGDLIYLRVVQLSHNFLSGDIPMTITNLERLRQFNLAANNMSGVIPWSLSNLASMTQMHTKRPGVDISVWYNGYVGKSKEVWPVVMKRQELKYGLGVFDVVSIDLSLNQLVGGVPEGITYLNGLLNLNLSWNHLSGRIPAKIGAMRSIESLDLSRNNLYGEIPSSLSDLTYLSSLDLSYNNLEGRIPTGTQLETLYLENPSIYTGNIGLCGPPLERNCSRENATKHVNQKISEKISEPALFFYFGLGSGFIAGLWVVFCALLFKKVWRVSYFRLFDRLCDNAYVFMAVNWGRKKGKATRRKVAREIK